MKNLLNELATSSDAVRKVSLSFVTLGISESLHFKKIIDFIYAHDFLMF